MLARQAEARIEMKTSEIKSLEAEIDFAKTEKNESRRKELEGRKEIRRHREGTARASA